MGTEDSDEPSEPQDESRGGTASSGDAAEGDGSNDDDSSDADDERSVDAAFEEVSDERLEPDDGGRISHPEEERDGPGAGERETDGPSADPVPESESIFGSGPESDQEMPLADHVEEMIRRLAAVVVVAGVVTAIVFPFGEEIINFLWYSLLPPSEDASPHIYSPPELLITQLKVASLGGAIAALPVLVYESYRFMRPGLYPHERRYYLAAVPTSLVLAFVGVTFAYFIVLPAVFTYFYNYTEGVSAIAFALGRTFDLILVLMGYLALVFQIPLFIMLAMMMGLVTRTWLVNRRLLFWGAFLGISFLFSPDPTGMSPLIITVTMIVLFEATLLLAKWAGKN